MERWLGAALDYIPDWLEFQMRAFERPGCIVAIAQRGTIVYEQAFGFADAVRGQPLTPRHRFRIASHSKAFTAAGILRLREQNRLRLDDRVGQFVEGLHPRIAETSLAQLLSHSAGLRRDMPDSGFFADRRPFPSAGEIEAELAEAPPLIEPNTRFKYSNLGFALLGKVIEAAGGMPYAAWIAREIVAPAGLAETVPDMPLLPRGVPMAMGHSGRIALGRRVVIPCRQGQDAYAPAGAFVSTAADVALFYNQLAPAAKKSVLAPASRREMIRRHWRDPNPATESYYGLGIMSGRIGGWDWFGHSGGLQGFLSRTATFPEHGLTVSVLTNSLDGLAWMWLEGIAHILQAFARHGAPARRVAPWRGRWWGLWGATDLVPMGKKVFAVGPGFFNPFAEASVIEVTGRDKGRIAESTGGGSYGEAVRLVRTARGKITAVQFAGTRAVSERALVKEMEARYEKRGRRKAKRRSKR
jgi:CubicO group peptidase (beta-lactamase class C family)